MKTLKYDLCAVKPMKKLILSGTILLLLSGCAATNVTPPVNNNQTSQTTTPSPIPAQTQSYKNSEYNFQFDYPATYASIDANYGNLENKIAQVQISSTAYPKTNFGDAAFTVSEATAKSLDECLTMNEPEGGAVFKASTTINGVTFYTTTGNGAGAGNYYETKNYRTLASSECFEIVETIHTSNIANYDPGTVTEIDKTPIWTELDNILSTFNFTP